MKSCQRLHHYSPVVITASDCSCLYTFFLNTTNTVLTAIFHLGWLRGLVVERQSLAGVLFLSCARPVADG